VTTSTTNPSTSTPSADPAATPELIRPPADDVLTGSEIGKFLSWLTEHRGVLFTDYQQLHHWSVTDLDGFWSAVWDYFGVQSETPYESVLGSREMPGAQWFPGATLNYARHAI
jgi:acetoacetyl-CoA synthetase